VIDPFRRLFAEAVRQLPEPLKEPLETERRLFSRFAKNDYGRGGSWDYYWGAIYPKGDSRVAGLQLFARIDYDQLTFGFSYGDPKSENAQRFAATCRQQAEQIEEALGDRFRSLGLTYGQILPTENGQFIPDRFKTAQDLGRWLRESAATDSSARVAMLPGDVIAVPAAVLAERIMRTFEALYPLVLIATEGNVRSALGSALGEPETEADEGDVFTLEQLAEQSGVPEDALATWVSALERKGQAILYGPPGTGKTFLANLLAKHLTAGNDGMVQLVQFHPAYAYEDFIQGIRPRVGGGDAPSFELVDGRFLEFCRAARERRGTCVLIIDEINRANLSRVFGELMYLLEYRNESAPLAAGGKLKVPSNVRIIGTMNTADRSIALVDHALRRRFAFIALHPDYEVLRQFHALEDTHFPVERLVDVLRSLNLAIGDGHYEVGITYFLRVDLKQQIRDIWRMEIEPYLEEYFFDQSGKVASYRWERVKDQIFA
jgi:5-methylcytosine-specific restriction protein B